MPSELERLRAAAAVAEYKTDGEAVVVIDSRAFRLKYRHGLDIFTRDDGNDFLREMEERYPPAPTAEEALAELIWRASRTTPARGNYQTKNLTAKALAEIVAAKLKEQSHDA